MKFFSKKYKKNKKLNKVLFRKNLSKQRLKNSLLKPFRSSITWGLFFLLVFSLCFFALNRPIEIINVVGELRRAPIKSIELVANSFKKKGFLSINASAAKQKIESFEWVLSAEIIRKWPNRVDILIKEENLLAIWNNNLILNDSAELYEVVKTFIPSNIPRFSGPEGSEKRVLGVFLKINKELVGRGLYLETLILDRRGSWVFTIKPKIEIRLGKKEIDQRLERLYLMLDQDLLANMNQISYIDLRYSEGLAISWKK